MNLSIENAPASGVGSDKIFVSIIGLDPATGSTSYVDFATGELAIFSSYVSGTTSSQLSKLQNLIAVPAIKSARIYLAIGQDFTSAEFPSSGPSASASTTVMFDKIEFDTSVSGQFNVNSTNVDFYAFSYTLTATPNGSNTPRTVGFTAARSQMISALVGVPSSPKEQRSGNTNIFPLCAIQHNRRVLRVLSPKTMALTDWGSGREQVPNATRASHFLDDYVNQHCWAPGRSFSFFDKFYPTALNERYGRVSSDGATLQLYTDAAMTQPYTPVPSLPRPSAAWPNPDFSNPANYHNANGASVEDIDWGFLLVGNSGGSGAGANWASDPAAMAIMVSIDRGVMHLNNGTADWIDAANYYLGDGQGKSTKDMPILFYSQILHQFGQDGAVYALSFDDVYGQNSSIFFADGGDVSIVLESLEAVPST